VIAEIPSSNRYVASSLSIPLAIVRVIEALGEAFEEILKKETYPRIVAGIDWEVF
jgi:hypothetical protein